MQPSSFDLQVLRWFAPLQNRPFWVDTGDTLSNDALFNGVVYALPLFLLWRCSGAKERRISQQRLLTIMLATGVGIAVSILLQQIIRWPPPSVYPPVRDFYTWHSPPNENPNSFPSDSAMLFSIVAMGTAAWSRRLSAGLFAWLVIFVAPARLFVGGHYPTDILAGILVGSMSLLLSKALVKSMGVFEKLAASDSPALQAAIFFWLFEVGTEFRELNGLLRATLHISSHHL